MHRFLRHWSLRRYTFVVMAATFVTVLLIACEAARYNNEAEYRADFNENAASENIIKIQAVKALATYERNVYLDGSVVGIVKLQFDTRGEETALRKAALTTYAKGISIASVCAAIALFILNQVVVSPISRIHEQMLKLQNDESPEPLKLSANKELTLLAETVNEFGNVLELSRLKKRELEEAAEASSSFDTVFFNPQFVELQL